MTAGKVITATATSTGAFFDTSEFSACFAVTDGSAGAGDIQFTSATYTIGEAGGTAAICAGTIAFASRTRWRLAARRPRPTALVAPLRSLFPAFVFGVLLRRGGLLRPGGQKEFLEIEFVIR